jgi:uncharacterized repeat protein (TIGR02543 family)
MRSIQTAQSQRKSRGALFLVLVFLCASIMGAIPLTAGAVVPGFGQYPASLVDYNIQNLTAGKVRSFYLFNAAQPDTGNASYNSILANVYGYNYQLKTDSATYNYAGINMPVGFRDGGTGILSNGFGGYLSVDNYIMDELDRDQDITFTLTTAGQGSDGTSDSNSVSFREGFQIVKLDGTVVLTGAQMNATFSNNVAPGSISAGGSGIRCGDFTFTIPAGTLEAGQRYAFRAPAGLTTPRGSGADMDMPELNYWFDIARIITTVNFDYNGGTGSPASDTVTVGLPYGTLPVPATSPAGYTFVGWFTALMGGTQVLDTTTVTNEAVHTLYALYTPSTAAVGFDFAGGTGSSAPITLTFGQPFGTLPSPGTRAGFTFDGWFTAASGGTQVTASTVVTEELLALTTLYAQWTAVSSPPGGDGGQQGGSTDTTGTAGSGSPKAGDAVSFVAPVLAAIIGVGTLVVRKRFLG